MTGSNMFSEFIGILTQCYSMLFVSKYLYLFLGIGCCIGASVVKLFLRWFNA